MKLILYSDGGSRGNPGPAAAGMVLKDKNSKTVLEWGEYLGVQTNNYAEYQGLILGLKKAKELGADEVECILDSELVMKQMNRIYKVKEPTLQKLFIEAYNTSAQFKKVTYRHTMRAGNKEADKMVNEALDKNIT